MACLTTGSARLWRIARGTCGSEQREAYAGYDGQTFTAFSSHDGLVHDAVSALLQDREAGLWIGTERGVSAYGGG